MSQTQLTKGTKLQELLISLGAGALATSMWLGLAAALVVGAFIILAVIGLLFATGAAKWIGLFLLVSAAFGLYIHFDRNRGDQEQGPPEFQREIWRPHGSVYGDAGWAYRDEIEALGLEYVGGEDWNRAIWLGRTINVETHAGYGNPLPYRYLRFKGETNIITFSSAGGGKNAAAVIPTLLVNPENAWVNDMKGENWFTTWRTRKELMGHRIIAINPCNMYGKELGYEEPMTAHYNPLEKLRPDQPDFVYRQNSIAAALIIRAGGEEPHWTERGKQLVAGVDAALCSNPVYYEAGRNTLPVMYEILSMPPAELAAWCKRESEASKVPLVRDNLAKFSESTKEIDGVVSTVIGQLNFLTEPALADFLSRSDFDLADLRREKMTIYCMLPPAFMDVHFRFVRLLAQVTFDMLASSPITERKPVLMLLDEQAKLGGMDIIKTAAATLRSYNVRIWSVYQDINQLRSNYPDAWETFIANAGLVQVMTVNDRATAEYFSSKIGNRGVMMTSTNSGSSSSTSYQGMPNRSSNAGISTQEQSVPFMSPQDFYNLPKEHSIVFVQGCRYPILTERLEYWKRADIYGYENRFQPWGYGDGIPYTLNPDHHPEILELERHRLEVSGIAAQPEQLPVEVLS